MIVILPTGNGEHRNRRRRQEVATAFLKQTKRDKQGQKKTGNRSPQAAGGKNSRGEKGIKLHKDSASGGSPGTRRNYLAPRNDCAVNRCEHLRKKKEQPRRGKGRRRERRLRLTEKPGSAEDGHPTD